jgi:hypothetical protein
MNFVFSARAFGTTYVRSQRSNAFHLFILFLFTILPCIIRMFVTQKENSSMVYDVRVACRCGGEFDFKGFCVTPSAVDKLPSYIEILRTCFTRMIFMYFCIYSESFSRLLTSTNVIRKI